MSLLRIMLGSCWVAFAMAATPIAAPAIAQLTVLSSGNPVLEWRKTQLAVLEQQLAEKELPGTLRLELAAQRRWLRAWVPGTMTIDPVWAPPKDAVAPQVEPILDPKEIAGGLRKRLLGPKAKPTAKDTAALERLLKQYPNDIGARQLHLHWLDQKTYRKQYPAEIADAALRLGGMLELVKPQDEVVKLARAHTLFRRVRALAYRELPDVAEQHPIQDREAFDAELVGAHEQLKGMARNRPEFILVDIRMLRRDGHYGRSLELLADCGRWIEQGWFLKKRRDLLRELGWEAPAQEAAEIYAAAFPEAVKAEANQPSSNDGLD